MWTLKEWMMGIKRVDNCFRKLHGKWESRSYRWNEKVDALLLPLGDDASHMAS